MRVGNDLCRVDRFFELLKNKKFIDRVFTQKEFEHILLAKNAQKQVERMAGKFSAKEAVAKALGLGISEGVTFRTIEILPNEKGAPFVVLYDYAKSLFEENGFSEIEISISNTEDFASSVCVVV